MDTVFVKTTLIEVLEGIQRDSGCAPVVITDSTCPVNDLQGFDSKIWPVAISLLANAIGVSIPNRANIFISTDGDQRLTIDEIVVEVCKLAATVA